jgi:DNA-binding transcriptional LysR family regulator
MNISQINLNLLVVLHSLLQTHNVTQTSEALFVTQSTISNALNKLRDTFDDELFIRTPKGMIPTARALSLEPQINRIIEEINITLYQPAAFDPMKAELTLTLAIADFAEYLLLPSLTHYLQKAAPKIKLVVQSLSLLDELSIKENHKIDLAIGCCYEKPAHHDSEVILTDHAVCIGCQKNPIFKKQTISEKAYLNAEHIAAYYGNNPKDNITDVFLKQNGKSREVDLWLPSIITSMHLLADSPYILSATEKLAKKFCEHNPLSYRKLPFLAIPGELVQMWHLRFAKSPVHCWLRDVIKTQALSL